MARRLFDDGQGDQLRGADAVKIGRQIDGQWEWLVAALCLAYHLRKTGSTIRKPVRYAVGAITDPENGFAVNGGISSEALTAMEKYRRPASPPPSPVRAPVPVAEKPPPPPTDEELAKWRGWAAGNNPATKGLGTKLLEAAGVELGELVECGGPA